MPNIFFKESGKGFPIVLLHGFCETEEIWKPFREALSNEFRVICPDLPGFGQSPLPDTPFQLADIAGTLHSWLNTIDVKKCVVIGHSLGGYIALAMLRKYPDFSSGIGLFNSSAFEDSPEKKANRNKLIEFIGHQGVAPFIKTFVPSLFYPPRVTEFETEIESIKTQGMKIAPEAVTNYARAMRDRGDSTGLLAKYRDKILLISGEKDQNVPLDHAKKMATHLLSKNFHVLPDTAHMGMYEQKNTSLKVVRDFAKEHQD